MKELKNQFDSPISLIAFIVIFIATLIISIIEDDKALMLISSFFLALCSFVYWLVYIRKED